jgi:hypothetical protein
MASNGTTGFATIEPYLVAYYALLLIIFGTSLNILTFIIFCRGKFLETNERPAIHYMRAIAVVDILMLYGWNLDHYLSNIYGFYGGSTSIAACKLVLFINYFAPQSAAWLRVFICLDRYLSLSRLHRTWFSHSKNVLMIIGGIFIFFFLLNIHLLILGCFYDSSGSITGNTDTYQILPMWDWVNLGVYNGLPFLCMAALNSGVIYHLIQLRRTSTVQNSRIHHRSISVTLVITTVLFMFLTIPPTVCYGFFYGAINLYILHLLDALMYTYHIIAFPLYLITFGEFRREFLNLIYCRNTRARVRPGLTSTKLTLNAT